MSAKTAAERTQALRQRMRALGLVRLDLYAHPDDAAAIKAQAAKMARRRARQRQSA